MLRRIGDRWNIFICYALLIVISTFSQNALGLETNSDKLRIGLISDTQIQTEMAGQDVNFYKSQGIDKLIKVTLRPPALNYSSLDMLKHLINKMIKDKVDLIVYLGDAANNGCTDELTMKILPVLKEVRNKVPVFIAVGNHDYLGAGNTTKKKVREQLCTDIPGKNPPLTKSDVVRLFHDFNVESFQLMSKNIADVYFKDSFGVRSVEDAKKREDKQIYLATYLKVKNSEIIILDSSDYGDKDVLYSLAGKEIFGVVGWISTKDEDSQLAWVVKQQEDFFKGKRPGSRYVFTHYPPKELGPVARLLPQNNFLLHENLLNRLSPIFVKPPADSNYWISAHTHNSPTVGQIDYKTNSGALPVTTLNFGSTTDYVPHGMLFNVTVDEPNVLKVGNTFAKQITITPESCSSINSMISEQRVDGIIPIIGHDDIATVCGINGSYKNKKWTPEATRLAYVNLDAVVKSFVAFGGGDPELVKTCIGLEASKREH